MYTATVNHFSLKLHLLYFFVDSLYEKNRRSLQGVWAATPPSKRLKPNFEYGVGLAM